MLTATLYRPEGSSRIDPKTVSQHLGSVAASGEELVWVDTVDPTDEDLAGIQEEFGLHPLAIEDVRQRGHRPKLELYPTHAFIVGYAHDGHPGDLPEVELFVGPNWLVSVRSHSSSGAVFPVEPVVARYERVRGAGCGVGLLLAVLVGDMVDGYFETLDESEEILERLETELFDRANSDPQSLQPRILELRRQLIVLRRRIVPFRDVVLRLQRREVPWLEEGGYPWLQDALDHLLRVLDQIDSQRELLGNLVDAYLGLVANRTNEVMKKMSSWGAILICATLIAGIYGMNFEDMPELRWRFGYPMALATMLVVTLTLYTYFRRKDWL